MNELEPALDRRVRKLHRVAELAARAEARLIQCNDTPETEGDALALMLAASHLLDELCVELEAATG